MEKSRNTKIKIIDIITTLPVKSVIAAVTLYRILISPLLGSRCRFYPSCSEYLIQAVEKRGLVKGMAIGIYRIGRCNPFNPGGYDPVK